MSFWKLEFIIRKEADCACLKSETLYCLVYFKLNASLWVHSGSLEKHVLTRIEAYEIGFCQFERTVFISNSLYDFSKRSWIVMDVPRWLQTVSLSSPNAPWITEQLFQSSRNLLLHFSGSCSTISNLILKKSNPILSRSPMKQTNAYSCNFRTLFFIYYIIFKNISWINIQRAHTYPLSKPFWKRPRNLHSKLHKSTIIIIIISHGAQPTTNYNDKALHSCNQAWKTRSSVLATALSQSFIQEIARPMTWRYSL